MSLYNNVSANLSELGKSSEPLPQPVMGLGSSSSSGLVGKSTPVGLQKIVNPGVSSVSSDEIVGTFPETQRGISYQSEFWGTSTPLFGGITPREAKQIYDEMRSETLAKKNLWLLEITSSLLGGVYNIPARFNMFATGLDYSPYQTEAEEVKVGGANVSVVNGSAPVEIQITTLDDQEGSIKRWYALHHAAASSRDGTVGEPGKFAVRIRIVHSFVRETQGAYQDIGLFRPSNLMVSLSRREDDVSELQLSFSQLDTFMRP